MKRLWLRSRGQLCAVDVDEIDWVEADAKYSIVHSGRASHRIRESISSVGARLDSDQFVRVHRSAIVNRDRVVEIGTVDGRSHAVLEGGARVAMSRAQRPRALELIGVDPWSIQRSVPKSILGIVHRNETSEIGNGGR